MAFGNIKRTMVFVCNKKTAYPTKTISTKVTEKKKRDFLCVYVDWNALFFHFFPMFSATSIVREKKIANTKKRFVKPSQICSNQ